MTNVESLKKMVQEDDVSPSQSPYTHEEYTVGWICALSIEYVAAQEFLDARHDRPDYLSRHDNNDYTLGKISEHNIVIAVSPRREWGLCPAAIVATNMLRSFPNVTIILMVGIGGGAPSPRRDIRLGDIVVSTSRGGIGAVYQYDLGKSTEFGFIPTETSKEPPTVLQIAVNRLRDQYSSNNHRLQDVINNILENNAELRKRYGRPDPQTDILYISGYIHQPGPESCAYVCSRDQIEMRNVRDDEQQTPTIHYGLIASANRIMKNSSERDIMIAEKDVLCFETEAAGVMNDFPCLVIRGICDYSDSHKYSEWQGYAAMVAAAYAKDLLRQIYPSKVEAEKKIRDTP
jgi:nucleoside phosphorylase